ncbi:M50 family metallopeptidase [Rudaeicoccus suwonensis]|uniref:Membrane-associated protease RseP (Regulator of RpoE activity) n=1 Tax=Rudaeicoccus suwonensis TaxID=657409 RepID=A0A561E9I4_9MICO|nr:M50 family metallopeptidase [Rudaeicoccus suwonensis]TWE12247.1 membrane-associated protease RseP (regulator of RpoE activity) [Rudaeicoccus suwonensis]
MLFVLGVLILLFGVAVSIALHEIGHLTPAKLFGVKVTQYMIGFGPTIWSRRRGETEYGVKAIPLGGYIRMIGMFPPQPGDDEGMVRASSTGRWRQMTESLREATYEEIPDGDRDRVFYKLPTWKKVVVMFGGPFMNLVIATVLLVIIACGIGLPAYKGAGVSAVLPCTADASGKTVATCAASGESAAARAGLKAGDQFVSVDGTKISSTNDLVSIVQSHPNQAIPVVVRRDGRDVTLSLTPQLQKMVRTDSNGDPVLNSKGQQEYADVGVIGVSLSSKTVYERQSLSYAPGFVGSALKDTASVFVQIPQKMVGIWNAAFGSAARSSSSPVSVVGVGRIAGDTTEAHTAVQNKVLMLLSIIASLNMALFVFNLVPLLPLDGGHIAGALWEAVKRPIARARGVKGPVYADVAKALPLAYGVSIVLLAMFVLLAYADIVKPVKVG